MGSCESFQCVYVLISGNEVGNNHKTWVGSGSLGKDGKPSRCLIFLDLFLNGLREAMESTRRRELNCFREVTTFNSVHMR